MQERICSVDDCGRPHYAKDLCVRHYFRARTHGSPAETSNWFSRENDLAPTDVPTGYKGTHHRLYATRGKAAEHACAFCAAPAKEWAFDHRSPVGPVLVGVNAYEGWMYSLCLDDYLPLCVSCHRKFDQKEDAA